MILVALFAILLGGGLGIAGLIRRARHFRQEAARDSAIEALFLRVLAQEQKLIDSTEQQAAWLGERIRDEDRLSRYFPSGNSSSRSLLNSMMRLVDQARLASRFHRDTATYYARLRWKYERAATHPWETVPPDPPPPTKQPEPAAPPEPVEPPSEPKRRTGSGPISIDFGPLRDRYSSGQNMNYGLSM
jgi:hypothetical protein